MRSHRGALFALSLFGTLALGEPAWATLDNLKSFKQAYPGKDPKAYSCKVCHQNAIGRKDNLNTYGKAFQTLKGPGNAKKLIVDDYRAIEKDDADGDGASNLDELNAGTDPADPASMPKGVAPKPAGSTAAPSPDASASSGVQPAPPKEGRAPSEKPQSSLRPDDAPALQAALDEWLGELAWAEAKDATAASKDAKSSAQAGPEKKAEVKSETPEKAEYVGMETCATCHAKQYEEFRHSTHARIAIPGVEGAQGCESCHGPGSLHVAAGGGRGVGGIINPRKDPSTCFACHLDKKVEFRLPYHHPVIEGKMGCTDCHNPHGEDVRPWSATTLQDINEVCFKCHKEQRGPFVWEHEALREGCTTCHKVHGSIHEKMLLVRDANLCLRCHTQTNFPTIGKSSHSSRLYQGTCFSAGCHTAVHGSNFSDHLRY